MPGLPDEVAVILRPHDGQASRAIVIRRPEHLVQHLLRAAQKLDASGGHADGVLFVDAPLPAEPARPLFLAALAVAAVIVLVFVLQQSMPNGPGPQPFTPAPAALTAHDKPPPREVPPKSERHHQEGPATPPVASPTDARRPGSRSMATSRHWQNSSKNVDAVRPPAVELTLARDLFIGPQGPGIANYLREGLALTSSRRILITSDTDEGNKRPRTIWLGYGGETEERAVRTALTLTARNVTLRGVRIVLQGGNALPMTAVHLVGGEKHEIEDCQFIQVNPSYDARKPLCSVLLEAAGEASVRPSLRLSGCVFVGGDEGSLQPR